MEETSGLGDHQCKQENPRRLREVPRHAECREGKVQTHEDVVKALVEKANEQIND